MIDISKLTQEEIWGLEFVVAQRNREIRAANAAIPEGSKQQPTPLYTRASYLEFVLRNACQSWYKECEAFKEKMATSAARQLPTETLESLFQQFGVPDAIDYTLIPD